METENYQQNDPEENPFKHVKTILYVLIFLGFIIYNFNIISSPCERCETIFNTKKYELKTGKSLFGAEVYYCDGCAAQKRKEIEKENKERSSYSYW